MLALHPARLGKCCHGSCGGTGAERPADPSRRGQCPPARSESGTERTRNLSAERSLWVPLFEVVFLLMDFVQNLLTISKADLLPQTKAAPHQRCDLVPVFERDALRRFLSDAVGIIHPAHGLCIRQIVEHASSG